jgi:hypothetical protein
VVLAQDAALPGFFAQLAWCLSLAERAQVAARLLA